MGCIPTKQEGAGAPNGASAPTPHTKQEEKAPPAKSGKDKDPPAKEKAGADPEFTTHMKEFGKGLFSQVTVKDKRYYCSCTKSSDTQLEFASISASNGDIMSTVYGEADLNTKKTDKTSWSAMFKSLHNAFTLNKLTLKEVTTGMSLGVPLEGGGKSNMSATLKPVTQNHAATLQRTFIDPMAAWFAGRRNGKDEARYIQSEQKYNEQLSSCGSRQQQITKLQADVEPLRKSCKGAFDDATAAKEQCEGVQKRIAQLKSPPQRAELYPGGPVQYVLHTQHAKEHIPQVVQPHGGALTMIKEKYGGDTSYKSPDVEKVSAEGVMQVLAKIDQWDFDVFALQNQTNGNSLFMTTYTLLYKYGLVQHFKIPEDVLINFLTSVESGYHPNAYHNSTHAADVLQITHYILQPGGMSTKIGMTKEDQLAALLSASIHDYDHPGFNNNFHCRTNSYLATLYNDRSVLENHHLAQIFDLMKTPKYNILGSLDDDQRKDVRDTMVEMVLSTDMGNHAKIFQSFRKRLSDDPEWNKKEDQRLALTIAIKMADISNCGRPQDLYLQWSKRIADEFYNQGDVEAKLKLTISPFMDRKKDKTDFSKGQISFMNYIVIPLFEAGAQFLTKMDFAVENIHSNKEYWQNKQVAD